MNNNPIQFNQTFIEKIKTKIKLYKEHKELINKIKLKLFQSNEPLYLTDVTQITDCSNIFNNVIDLHKIFNQKNLK